MDKTIAARHSRFSPTAKQGGFSLVEVMVSMVVLMVGLLSLLGVFGMAMASTQESQEDMIAKQLADEALESIMTARDTAQKQWSDIQNVSDGGIFLNGYQPMYMPGGDGILGTADDVASGQYITLTEPGPDGIYGTADDVKVKLSNYQRQVQILPVVDPQGSINPTLRSINVTIKYYPPRRRSGKTYVLSSLISQYR